MSSFLSRSIGAMLCLVLTACLHQDVIETPEVVETPDTLGTQDTLGTPDTLETPDDPPPPNSHNGLACEENLPPVKLEGAWSWVRMPGGQHANLMSVVWTGARLVAVGTNGSIETSPDGLEWSPQTSGTAHTLHSIACAPIGLVAVGDSGTILRSPDGVTWSSGVSGTETTLLSLIWTGTQFVAVGDEGAILTSVNGSDWTTRLSGTGSPLRSVAASDERIVAVGDGGLILSSADGSSWTQQESGTDQSLVTVVWAGDRFLTFSMILSSSSGFMSARRTSSDGIEWVSVPGTQVPHFKHARRIGDNVAGVYLGDVPSTEDKIAFSVDSGSGWVVSASKPVFGARDIAWTGERVVILGGRAIRSMP